MSYLYGVGDLVAQYKEAAQYFKSKSALFKNKARAEEVALYDRAEQNANVLVTAFSELLTSGNHQISVATKINPKAIEIWPGYLDAKDLASNQPA